MKKSLLAFVVFFVMVAITFVDGGKASAQTSFIVSNQQSDGLGMVTVSTPIDNYYLSVPGNSTDTVNITDSSAAVSITINGQTVPQGQQAYVTLPDQTVVAVMWETQWEVIIIDPDEL